VRQPSFSEQYGFDDLALTYQTTLIICCNWQRAELLIRRNGLPADRSAISKMANSRVVIGTFGVAFLD
jgi:hypothetical protein